jgi:hypothetical protein
MGRTGSGRNREIVVRSEERSESVRESCRLGNQAGRAPRSTQVVNQNAIWLRSALARSYCLCTALMVSGE